MAVDDYRRLLIAEIQYWKHAGPGRPSWGVGLTDLTRLLTSEPFLDDIGKDFAEAFDLFNALSAVNALWPVAVFADERGAKPDVAVPILFKSSDLDSGMLRKSIAKITRGFAFKWMLPEDALDLLVKPMAIFLDTRQRYKPKTASRVLSGGSIPGTTSEEVNCRTTGESIVSTPSYALKVAGTYFGGPTNPARGSLLPGDYRFGIDGNPVNWHSNVYTIPNGTPMMLPKP